MNRSKRHHYLPQSYTAKFADKHGELNVYDKVKDCYFKGTPLNLFVENNRNSLMNEAGIVDDNLEKVYAKLDGKFAATLSEVVETGKLTVEGLRMLLLLAYTTKWRIPQYDDDFADLRDDLNVSDLGLGLRSKGVQIDVDLEPLFNSEEMQEMKRLLFAIQPFRFKEDYQKIFKNSFLLPSPYPSVIGDCPFNEYPLGEDLSFEDFIFPVASHLTLIHSKRIDKRIFHDAVDKGDYKNFIGLFSRTRDGAILDISKRFVACSDKGYLEEIVGNYKKTLVSTSTPELIRFAVFEVIHNYTKYLKL